MVPGSITDGIAIPCSLVVFFACRCRIYGSTFEIVAGMLVRFMKMLPPIVQAKYDFECFGKGTAQRALISLTVTGSAPVAALHRQVTEVCLVCPVFWRRSVWLSVVVDKVSISLNFAEQEMVALHGMNGAADIIKKIR